MIYRNAAGDPLPWEEEEAKKEESKLLRCPADGCKNLRKGVSFCSSKCKDKYYGSTEHKRGKNWTIPEMQKRLLEMAEERRNIAP